MSYKQDTDSKQEPKKCTECQIFYASEAFKGLCSSCYKMIDHQKPEKKIQTGPNSPSTPLKTQEVELKEAVEQLNLEPQKVEQKDRKRCFGCNKKVGLLGIECKCGFIFCNAHRLPQNHQCTFNHGQKGRLRLKDQIVRVDKAKIQQI